ncbi:hypothetical protein [uncultured Hoeflea sp.]|uniref:hypothetical protein n=1 Tax=uncultured Hoeflea sp. TaxID=538666 RepID=UPI0030D7FB79
MTDGLGSSWFVGPFPHIAAVDPGGPFGSILAIAPNFEALQPVEQVSAVNLMLERGHDVAEIAERLDRSTASIEAISSRRCQPIRPRGEGDEVKRRPGTGPKRRPTVDRLLDDTLMAIDALRAKAGVGHDMTFDLTLEEVCQACGFGLETARRRFRELESRKWVRRTLRPGLPARVTISLAGRCRLDALAERRGKS